MRADLGVSFGQYPGDRVDRINRARKLKRVNPKDNVNGKKFRGSIEAEVKEEKRINQILDERQELSNDKKKNDVMDAYKVMNAGNIRIKEQLQHEEKTEEKDVEEER